MLKGIKINKLLLFAVVFFLVIIATQWNTKRIMFSNYIKNTSEFYLNPKDLICDPNKKLLLIAFVVIAPDSFEKRNVIRSTWGSNFIAPDEFKLVFSVGKSKNSTINEILVN